MVPAQAREELFRFDPRGNIHEADLQRRAWGDTEVAGGARASTPLRFQGQYADDEIELRYNRWRYYKAVGHTPDACAGGPSAGGKAMALDSKVNSSVGGQVGSLEPEQTYNRVELEPAKAARLTR
ncbi:MAG: polymorphic toxin type 15 domain-containing protein [Planctomycetaceae bacterium]